MPIIKELPIDERPREKLKLYGPKKLSNTELLAMLIGSGSRKQSAVDLAGEILSSHNGEGLSFLASCSLEELSSLPGIGIAKSCQIVSAVELGKRISSIPKSRRVSVHSPDNISLLFMDEMRHLTKEIFKVLLLNSKNEILSIEDISVGNLNSAIINAREVFYPAIKRGAASIALVHNHPSGNPEPSVDDIKTTGKLVEAGDLLGIKVIDHLIIGDGDYISLRSIGKI